MLGLKPDRTSESTDRAGLWPADQASLGLLVQFLFFNCIASSVELSKEQWRYIDTFSLFRM